MDEIDLKILKELTKNVQMPFSQIAKKIGVSPKTIQKKYKKMKEQGIILRSTITIDISKIGYEGKAFLTITNVPGQDKATTINALKQVPNIVIITEIIGDFDFLAVAVVKDFTSIINMVDRIRKIPSVEQVEVAFVTDTSFPLGKEFNEQFPIEKEVEF